MGNLRVPTVTETAELLESRIYGKLPFGASRRVEPTYNPPGFSDNSAAATSIAS